MSYAPRTDDYSEVYVYPSSLLENETSQVAFGYSAEYEQ